MMDYLKNNIWLIVSAVFAAAVFILTLILVIKAINKKRLTYKVIAKTALTRVGDKGFDKITVRYDGVEIEDIYLTNLKIYNSGSIPIKTSDFEADISVVINKGARILEAGIKETSPPDLIIEPFLKDNKVNIRPLLLNPADYFIIDILTNSEPTPIIVSSRIVGIKRIVEYKEPVGLTFVLGLISGMIGTTLVIFISRGRIKPIAPDFAMFVYPTLLAAIAMTIGIVFITKQYKYFMRILRRSD